MDGASPSAARERVKAGCLCPDTIFLVRPLADHEIHGQVDCFRLRSRQIRYSGKRRRAMDCLERQVVQSRTSAGVSHARHREISIRSDIDAQLNFAYYPLAL